MKQHIREEQWYEEISDKQREIFSKKVPNVNDTLFPSIGQMIEFLGDDIQQIRFIYNEVVLFYPEKELGEMTHTFSEFEICDSLWEAVKYKFINNK